MPFYINWKQGEKILRGYDLATKAWVDGEAFYPVLFPGTTSAPQEFSLTSSARDSRTFEVLNNLRFYVTGDPQDVSLVMSYWPFYGRDLTNPAGPPTRPELNGGFEISFDLGQTWQRFQYNTAFLQDTNNLGYEQDPSTWLVLPAKAVGLNGIDGQLGPFDMATILTRFVVPTSAKIYKRYDVRLEADFDPL